MTKKTKKIVLITVVATAVIGITGVVIYNKKKKSVPASGSGSLTKNASGKSLVVGNYDDGSDRTWIHRHGNQASGFFVKGRVKAVPGKVFSTK